MPVLVSKSYFHILSPWSSSKFSAYRFKSPCFLQPPAFTNSFYMFLQIIISSPVLSVPSNSSPISVFMFCVNTYIYIHSTGF